MSHIHQPTPALALARAGHSSYVAWRSVSFDPVEAVEATEGDCLANEAGRDDDVAMADRIATSDRSRAQAIWLPSRGSTARHNAYHQTYVGPMQGYRGG